MGNGMGGLYAARRRNGDGPVLRQEPPKPRKSPAKKAAAKKSPAKAPSKKAPAKKSPAKKSPARARKSTAPKLAAQPGSESNSGGDRRTDQ